MRLSLTEIKKRISKIIPNDIEFDVDLEAGSISIITKQPSAFIGSGDSLTVQIAKSIKRRVVIRPHPSILCDESAIHQAITKFIPSEV